MNSLRSSRRADSDPLAAECDGSADQVVDIGTLVAHVPETDPDRLRSFAERVVADAVNERSSATDVAWQYSLETPTRPSDPNRRRPKTVRHPYRPSTDTVFPMAA